MATVVPMVRETTLGDALSCRRVLVAEDDRALLELLVDFLELEGLEVTAAESGEEALRALAKEPGPELVVLDIRMPGVPGDEVLRRMRASPRLARIPVVAITGMQRGEVELLAHPDEYVSKPFDIESLAAAIRRMCAHRSGAAGTDDARDAS